MLLPSLFEGNEKYSGGVPDREVLVASSMAEPSRFIWYTIAQTTKMSRYGKGQHEACCCIRSWNHELVSSVATETLDAIDFQFAEQLWHERLNGLDATSDASMVLFSVSGNGLM